MFVFIAECFDANHADTPSSVIGVFVKKEAAQAEAERHRTEYDLDEMEIGVTEIELVLD